MTFRHRLQTNDDGSFDEFVLGTGKHAVVHVEMTDGRSGYADVCGFMIWFHVGKDGVPRITESEDGRTARRVSVDLRDPVLDGKRRKKES